MRVPEPAHLPLSNPDDELADDGPGAVNLEPGRAPTTRATTPDDREPLAVGRARMPYHDPVVDDRLAPVTRRRAPIV